MEIMTLRELCETCGVSRRAVQGYEKHGLVRAYGKNESGYLLYDVDAQKQVCGIKMYQRVGFRLREISQFLNATDSTKMDMLESRLAQLEQESAELNKAIMMTQEMINNLKQKG